MTGNEYVSEETVLQKLIMYCYGTQVVIMLMVMQDTEKPPSTISHRNSQNINNFIIFLSKY